jgi:hypothetical protein
MVTYGDSHRRHLCATISYRHGCTYDQHLHRYIYDQHLHRYIYDQHLHRYIYDQHLHRYIYNQHLRLRIRGATQQKQQSHQQKGECCLLLGAEAAEGGN